MNQTHGHRRGGNYSPEYNSWRAMRSRCLDPAHSAFNRYGGRGIKIHLSWNDFECFLRDMGPRSPGESLDRYPNRNGNYEPGNCRWASSKTQANNTCKTVMIEYKGRTKPLTEWASELGIKPTTLHLRLKKYPLEKAMHAGLFNTNGRPR